jgi:hypothetical protein
MKKIYLERQKGVLLTETLPTERGPAVSGRRLEPRDVTPSPSAVPPISHYPVGCLVFVKNLNPYSNKTVLQSLLASPFQAESSGCIEYVDYTKGLDSVSRSLGHRNPTHPEL